MRGIRKQSSDTQSSSQPKEKRGLDTKQKKGMLIGGGIFLVAVIALILVKNRQVEVEQMERMFFMRIPSE